MDFEAKYGEVQIRGLGVNQFIHHVFLCPHLCHRHVVCHSLDKEAEKNVDNLDRLLRENLLAKIHSFIPDSDTE